MSHRWSPLTAGRRRRYPTAAAARLAAVAAVAVLGGALIAGGPATPTPKSGAQRLATLAPASLPGLDRRPRPAFPGTESLRAARRFAAHRSGTVSFAVIDDRGRLRGLGRDHGHPSASLTKAMMLVAYLTQLHDAGSPIDDADRALLDPMIRYSDNGAATQVQGLLAPEALEDLADRAGMTRFGYHGDWANATVTAADQARFFLRADRLTPPRHRDYARELLASITPEHRWGIPAAAPQGWSVFFKGGWRPTAQGELVHQAALLDRRDPGGRIAIAVLTEGSPTHDYGTGTVRGVAARLLAAPPLTAPGAAFPGGPL